MGQDVIDKLENHKVNTRFIKKVPDGMGTWLAIFDNRGDVTAAISKRPDTTPLIDLLAEQGMRSLPTATASRWSWTLKRRRSSRP